MSEHDDQKPENEGNGSSKQGYFQSSSNPPAKEYASAFSRLMMGVYLLFAGVALGVSIFAVWDTPAGSGDLSTETRLMLIVLLVGGLGGWLHATSSFARFVGNRDFVKSWLWWYFIRPFIGGGLALIAYFAIRGGLFPNGGTVTSEAISDYGVAAFAALTGLFSHQATKKLREVFETLFRTAVKDKDSLTGSTDNSDWPVIERLEPASVPVGSDSRLLHIIGQGMSTDCQVLVRSQLRLAKQDGDGNLEVELAKEDLATAGALPIEVRSPAGSRSVERTLEVTASPPPTRPPLDQG